ncbi:hypothetical protein C361_00216 [Cryptococcus neoformans Tu259-1]|uniref:SURP motif domain-containing protein n=1 Tax=Cryptococcus neoformans Tu259-1 TaxID=1230072 RepID=A0A854QR55_CRYNE|nr:hypothetical protein C361_00216 [Cryptococcus neoformans var. grubii Tu259-1]
MFQMPRPPKRPPVTRPPQQQYPSTAYIHSYEASLTYPGSSLQTETGGLIKYAGEVQGNNEIWADRHDIIHLLPSLPNASSLISPPSPTSYSSSSWSLPSDTEEVWYLSDPEEIEAYKNEKKKKWMEALRQERLREREREDLEAGKVEKVGHTDGRWDPDEEPPTQILTLMSHTATSIFSSPNPSILEMRILTHHSSDERFAFLRGRWRNAWDKVKGDIKGEKENKRRLEEKQRGLGGLGGYESGSEESEEVEEPPIPPEDDGIPPPPPEVDDTIPPPPPVEESESGTLPPPQPQFSTEEDQEEEKRRQRRLRVEEWKKQRISG